MEAQVITSRLLTLPGVVHGFSTRQGGVSEGPFAGLNLGRSVGDVAEAVEENHGRLLRAVGAEGARWADIRQVHGATVVRVEQGLEQPFAGGDADGILTDRPGWLVGVRTADCVPILIAGAGVVGAVHAGWRGTAARIVIEAVRQIERCYGVAPAALRAAVGPSIGAECYPVGEEVAEGLERALADSPGGSQGVVRRGEDRRVDLREANRRLLLEAGLSEAAVEVIDVCVACEPARFYSHRRDRGVTGRMFNFIGLWPA